MSAFTFNEGDVVDWIPISKPELERYLLKERDCLYPERRALLDRYAVDPCSVIVERFGRDDEVFVVARAADHVVFFDDIEDEFGTATEAGGRLIDPAIYGPIALTIGVLEEMLHPKPPPPPPPVEPPAPIDAAAIPFIKQTVARFFGPDAVIRNYGPDPAHLRLHVETDREPDMEDYECAGVLMTRIDLSTLTVTRRGTKTYGDAKIAYRQGVIL